MFHHRTYDRRLFTQAPGLTCLSVFMFKILFIYLLDIVELSIIISILCPLQEESRRNTTVFGEATAEP